MTFYNRNKRGQIQGIIVYGVVAFVLLVSLLLAGTLLNSISDAFDKVDTIPDSGKASITILSSQWNTIADSIYVFTLIILLVVVVISSFLIDSHPIFFVITLPSFLAVLLVNAILANAIDDVGRTEALVAVYSNMPMTLFIGQHWLALITVVGFIGFIVLYTKR